MLLILRDENYLTNHNALTFKSKILASRLMSGVSESQTAFIAMWFDEKMKDAKEAIKAAIKECDYVPIIIDEKEHANFIVPEIFYEIKRSKFIIADYSGQRNGVYYEAGYARGIGKEVIMTCKDTYFSDIHFDTKQINCIKWETPDELKEKLVKRIEAVVGRYNKI